MNCMDAFNNERDYHVPVAVRRDCRSILLGGHKYLFDQKRLDNAKERWEKAAARRKQNEEKNRKKAAALQAKTQARRAKKAARLARAAERRTRAAERRKKFLAM